ncbi:TPA: hypothetical protein DCL89_01310 [candidate division WWE3 bacterium]|nr:MAG: hypothetical protein A2200_01110 [candidate division WWE3 bacterium RIFOXYA1_FULL_41_11]OGC63479.1 MAG: hypothetical protein A2399_03225 [candidate division WWE3 bacterium RIFOXYB1_FULL_42_27]OGC71433.1 MAG: hypothetical protein A2578_01450 [candidate division WWE3 bacterium RIFOXYD1_FULL_42_24]HAI62845.1 hypothetical protein [candidate division WWE3 bacterium]HBI35894.1 hypothetical protein [candidate division WWE3 bacterium]
MLRKGYLMAYLVQISEENLKVVILAVTTHNPPFVKIFDNLEEARTAVFGITGAHLPELTPITKDVFWSNIKDLKKSDERLAPINFGSVLKRLV